ncbi:hypothetical protein HZH66_008272 [Vespula vulgaris]|uniref:Uncharacterized protein n=1 Tax=Vespula vulgaris TaxID=7454 RepID=A0A834JUT7_VESVU|nr:hypothetical protein HZH66_008272 [Vespula vulgaris]
MSATLPSNRPTWRSPSLGEVLTSGMLLPGAEDPSLGFLELLVRDLSLITDCIDAPSCPTNAGTLPAHSRRGMPAKGTEEITIMCLYASGYV